MNWGQKCPCSFQLHSTRDFWKKIVKMMEMVDVIRNLLKSMMRGLEARRRRKKKRLNKDGDKEAKSKKGRWMVTLCGEVMPEAWSNALERSEHTSSLQGRVFT